MKEKKGITLVALLITVTIMLILASVSIYSGIEINKDAIVKKFVYQMQLIQTKIDSLNIDEINGLGQQVTSQHKSILLEAYNNGEISDNTEDYFNNFKYFSIEELRDELDIDNVTAGVLINFFTKEIVSEKGVKHNNRIYYTQYLLSSGQNLIEKETVSYAGGNDIFSISKEMRIIIQIFQRQEIMCLE